MQAITTRYHGPGNVRGSRFSAVSESGLRVTVPYNYALNSEQNHRAACLALCLKLGWHGTLYCGQVKNGDYAWVFADAEALVIP